jgi:PBP1b-binding outer membrane lipoprotein LpoB
MKIIISLILAIFLLLTSCSKGRKLVSPVAPVGTEATTPSGSETKSEEKKEESKKEEPKTDYLGWISWGVSAVAYTAIAAGVTYAIYKAIDLEHEGP